MLPPMALPSVSWLLFSCLMLLSQVQGQESKKELDAPQSNCPEGSYYYRSYCYVLYITPKSWSDAHIECLRRHSGSLVSVLSEADASFLASLVKSNANTCPNVWIGIHDPTKGSVPNAGGWEWSNNDILKYHAWEKNPATSSNPGYCGTLSQSSGYLKWKYYDCRRELPYICKFKY